MVSLLFREHFMKTETQISVFITYKRGARKKKNLVTEQNWHKQSTMGKNGGVLKLKTASVEYGAQ